MTSSLSLFEAPTSSPVRILLDPLLESIDLNISRSLVTEFNLVSVEVISSCNVKMASFASLTAELSRFSNLDFKVCSSCSNLAPNSLVILNNSSFLVCRSTIFWKTTNLWDISLSVSDSLTT